MRVKYAWALSCARERCNLGFNLGQYADHGGEGERVLRATALAVDWAQLKRIPTPVWAGAGLGLLLLLAVLFQLRGGAPGYATAPVTEGPFAVVINATGTLAPREEVDVGAEISGRIDSVAVDFNDRVHKGQVLARINTDVLTAQLEQAEATLMQSRAVLAQASDTVHRDHALSASGAVSPQQMIAAESDLSRAQAGVDLAAAQVSQDQSKLSRATIYSPIDGVVLDRKVSAGQTIVTAMSTPVLFTLSSALSEMNLNVAIPEDAVGQVHNGDQATFSVSAYPGRQFSGVVTAIRDAPRIVQGVVTYEGVLLVENRDGVLKPGMTAEAVIDAAWLKRALLIPNDALRFTPAPSTTAPALPPVQNGLPWVRVWTLAHGTLAARAVRLGASDGKRSVVLAGDLHEGEAVVVPR